MNSQISFCLPAERHDPPGHDLIGLGERRPAVGQVELFKDPEHGLVSVPRVMGGVEVGIAGL